MKKLKFLVAIVLLLGITSCQDNEDLTPNPSYTGASNGVRNTNKGTMTAKVNGTVWNSTVPTANIVNGVINVTGIAADGSLIVFTLFDKGEGTYSFKAGDGSGVYQVSQTESYNAGDTTGTVVVSEINTANKTVSGTFEFVGLNFGSNSSKRITEGKFTNLSYATEVSPVNNTNAMKADVDGVTFTPTVVTGTVVLDKLTINGSDNQANQSIGFHLPPDIAVGTYTLTDIFGNYVGQYNRSSSEFFEANGGQITITKHDQNAKLIEGSFDFTAEQFLVDDTVSITNGTFKTTY